MLVGRISIHLDVGGVETGAVGRGALDRVLGETRVNIGLSAHGHAALPDKEDIVIGQQLHLGLKLDSGNDLVDTEGVARMESGIQKACANAASLPVNPIVLPGDAAAGRRQRKRGPHLIARQAAQNGKFRPLAQQGIRHEVGDKCHVGIEREGVAV